MRIIVADCSAEYSGRLNAYLPEAKRVLLIKADNSFLIFSELGSYKPLNWMAAPCTIKEIAVEEQSDEQRNVEGEDGGVCEVDNEAVADPQDVAEPQETAMNAAEHASSGELEEVALFEDDGTDLLVDEAALFGNSRMSGAKTVVQESSGKIFRVAAQKSNDILEVTVSHVYSDHTYDLGKDPGLVKDGVEDHLQRYLAEQIERIGKGATLVRREYPTPVGPVDIMAKDANGGHVAIEIKRHGGIDGVEQLTRYCALLNEDPLIAPVRGIFAAQTITPQAKVLAESRGFECLILDYDDMKGTEDDSLRLF